MTANEPLSITQSSWYRLLSPVPKPEIWDLSVGNGQHLGWDRCWAYVLSHSLNSREISIVWAIGYAMKEAAERVARTDAEIAYEQGWRDACDDHLDNKRDPGYPIGTRKRKFT